jgi:CBS domain-containing protein
MKVKEIMTEDVIMAEVPSSSSDALELILKHNVSGVPVVKRGTKELIGVVTRNDFARKPDEGQLALLMTRDVQTISPEADVTEAAELFKQRKFRRLPVVEDGEVVGILTVSDIIWKAIARSKNTEPIDNYLDTISAIWGKTPLKVAHEIMRLSSARALPVLDDDGEIIGMIADTDLLKVLEISESTQKSELSGGTEGDAWGWDSKNVVYITKKKLMLPDKTAEDVMNPDVISATRQTGASEAAKKMAKARIEQLPVIDAEGNLIGIVKDVDLLGAL